MSIKHLSDYIKERMTDLDLNKTEIAKQASISRQALYIMLGSRQRERQQKGLDEKIYRTKLSTFIKLAKVLDTHPLTLVRTLIYGMEFETLPNQKYFECFEQEKLKNIDFIKDISQPENLVVTIEQRFIKTLVIENTTSITWENYFLKHIDNPIKIKNTSKEFVEPMKKMGLQPQQTKIPIPKLLPKEKITLDLIFFAPLYPGCFSSHWKIVDNYDSPIFKQEYWTCQALVIDA